MFTLVTGKHLQRESYTSDFKEAGQGHSLLLRLHFPPSDPTDLFLALQPLALKLPMLLGSFPCSSAGPLKNTDLQSPPHSTYICTHMQMEEMDFSAHRQPEFWQVLRVSGSLKKLFPKKINWSLENYNIPLPWVTDKVQQFWAMKHLSTIWLDHQPALAPGSPPKDQPLQGGDTVHLGHHFLHLSADSREEQHGRLQLRGRKNLWILYTYCPSQHPPQCHVGLSSLPKPFSTQSGPPPLPTSISYSPAIPVPFLCTPCRLQPSCSLLFSLFSEAQTGGAYKPKATGNNRPGALSWQSIIYLIGNNSQGRRFPSLPRWSCNSFMMITGYFLNIQPKSSWQISKSVN